MMRPKIIATGAVLMLALAACADSMDSATNSPGASSRPRASAVIVPAVPAGGQSGQLRPTPPPILDSLLAKLGCTAISRRASSAYLIEATCVVADGSAVRVAVSADNDIRTKDLSLESADAKQFLAATGDDWSAICSCPPADLAALHGTLQTHDQGHPSLVIPTGPQPTAPPPILDNLLAKLSCTVSSRPDDFGRMIDAKCTVADGSVITVDTYVDDNERDQNLSLMTRGSIGSIGDDWSATCICPATDLGPLNGTPWTVGR